MLRLGAAGAAGLILSSAAARRSFRAFCAAGAAAGPLPPVPAQPQALTAPGGIDPQLFARAKAALDRTSFWPRDSIGIVDFSQAVERAALPRRRPAERRGRKPPRRPRPRLGPRPFGLLEKFCNDFGSYASSNGAYTTGDYYDGKYGLSMKVPGLDWSNNNAEPRAIVIHNAWYAEEEMIPQHGKLGRSEGCFAMPPDEPVGGDAQARRRPHDLRRQAQSVLSSSNRSNLQRGPPRAALFFVVPL